ncbi:MAG: tetratricopeptide repeat protein [Gemmataceae bacterium]
MATLTAEKQAAPHTPRPLWHAPLFLIGLAALAGAWFGRPLWPESADRRVRRDLVNARAALAKPDGDPEYALKLANRAIEKSASMPEHSPEAAFLAGSALMRVAEKGGPAEAWSKARALLEQANEAGLRDEEDQHQLTYRLAKVGARTGMEPRKVADHLEASAAFADNRPEAYTLLTRTYMTMKPPDLELALKANLRMRELQEIPEADLSAAKLLGGDILLKLGRPAEARKSLEKIDDRSPPETAQRARMLRARAYQDEKEWGEAAIQYSKALADGRQTADAPLARYHLGVCYRGLGQAQEAARAWQQCLNTGKGPEVVAAAVALAELHLSEPALEPALEAVGQAAARVKPGAKWNNPLLEEARLGELFARARKAFQAADRADLAYQLAAHQARFLDAPRALVLRAESAAGWGKVLAAKGPDGMTKSRELLAEAGAAFEEAAGQPGLKPEEQAEYLYQAATNYLAGENKEKGASALFKMSSLEGKPERMGEACYRLAEHYREAGDRKKAAEKYHDCMKYETRFEYLARFRLAMADLENGDLDNAQAALVYNLKMLRWEEEPDAMAESLFALSNLLYQKREYSRVVRYLEELLGRAKDSPKYKDSPELTRSRFQLADAYRQIAAREVLTLFADGAGSKESREHREQQHRLYLQRAADEFLKLDAFLDTPAGDKHLPKDQRGRVPFHAGKCLFNLGKYKEALEVYDRLARQHENKVEGLEGLGQAVACHAALKQINEVRQRLIQVEQAIPHVDKKDGDAWKEWAKQVRSSLPPIE